MRDTTIKYIAGALTYTTNNNTKMGRLGVTKTHKKPIGDISPGLGPRLQPPPAQIEAEIRKQLKNQGKSALQPLNAKPNPTWRRYFEIL